LQKSSRRALRSPPGNTTRSEAATLGRAAMPPPPSACWGVRAAATHADALRVAEFLAASFLAEVRGAGLTPAQWTELESEQLGRDPAQWQHIGAARPGGSSDLGRLCITLNLLWGAMVRAAERPASCTESHVGLDACAMLPSGPSVGYS